MKSIINNFRKFVYCESISLETDGYIGIPVTLTVLYDSSFGNIRSGAGGTPIILYVVNSAIERIGTEDDREIVSSMLSRGYAVVILDYKNNKLADTPELDYSVQIIRRRLVDQNENDVLSVFGEGKYIESFVVPAGYDVELSNPYWAFDKHGADGILEKITEIWNNDFKGTNAETFVKWTDKSGKRKKTEAARDGSLPVWCDKNGIPADDGEYIKIKYTYAEDISDCVKKNGEPIDLNLYMHLIYPKRPKKPVPVMCLSSSSEHLANGSCVSDRPHMNGFLFRGYAGVMFDYGYTPMARVDHYGYFDGYPKAGYVTGDNATYSMSFYNDKRIFTAAMRYIRYLALSDERFAFDTDAIGVYGNSKGAWMTFLGEENPEKFTSKRILAAHHDETRYEAGYTESIGIIRGGEEQPWMKFGEIEIKSGAELTYSSCGGLDDSITDKHCPVFISCNRTDSSCYSTSDAMLAACRNHNVPTMWVDIPLPHTIVSGTDLVYGNDTYRAFYDFTGYYLKGDSVKVVATKVNTDTLPYNISIKFSGAVSENEITKITLISKSGAASYGKWRSLYGGVEWRFTPDTIGYNEKYVLTIPQTLKGSNGRFIEREYTFTFVSPKTLRVLLSDSYNKDTLSLSQAIEGRNYIVFEVTSDGFNNVALSSSDGTEYASVNTYGMGLYRIDVTAIIDKIKNGFVLSTTKNPGEKIVYESRFESDFSSFSIGKRAKASLCTSPDGKPSIKIFGFKTVTEHPTEEFYSYPDVALFNEKITGDDAFYKKDMGRCFNVSLRLYDTVSRYVKISLSHATSMEKSISDYQRLVCNVVTKAGEWIDVSLDVSVYEFMYNGLDSVGKTLFLSCYGTGDVDSPIYLAYVQTVERITPVKIGKVHFITEEEPKDTLPEGQCDIICKKSPWQK